MKRLLLPLLLITSPWLCANTIVVTIQDFQFSPNNFNVNVGDIIRWTWVSGSHTTTSTTVPTGAATWDMPMNSTHTQYDYTVTTSGAYTFRCVPHAAFGMTGSFNVNSVVPIKLATFSVKAISNGNAIVSWETLTEDNADFFSVQRSENGKDFYELTRMKAAGNAVTPHTYNFTDSKTDKTSLYYYYQLVTTDFDKNEQRSRILLYRQPVKHESIIVKLSPNPVQSGEHLQLWFNANKESKLQASIYDISGKTVYEAKMTAYAGVNFGHLHIHDLPPGMYVLKLSIGELKQSVKIEVQ
jgi:plastocyanin